MKELLLAFLTLFIGTAHGAGAPPKEARWIVRNARASLDALVDGQHVRTMAFGNDTYEVIRDRSGLSAARLKALLRADEVTPDFPVGLIAPVRAETAGRAGWHVQQLGYAGIPAGADGHGVTVAILDTGMELDHPFLKDRLWTNDKEIAGNGVDDDGNGYVDDLHGFNFTARDKQPEDFSGHGTHVGGLVSTKGAHQNGSRGAAPEARLMVLKIIGDEYESFLSDTAEAVRYAADHGARILSNSWRVYKSWDSVAPTEQNLKLLRGAIAYAESKGALFVAAAGNESNDIDRDDDPTFPLSFAGLSNLVGVAASDSDGNPASFTSYGRKRVRVAAPGDGIYSTYPGGGWATLSGTSMATPIVAGILAAALSTGVESSGAVDRLVTTSEASPRWTHRTQSGGVINLARFFQ